MSIHVKTATVRSKITTAQREMMVSDQELVEALDARNMGGSRLVRDLKNVAEDLTPLYVVIYFASALGVRLEWIIDGSRDMRATEDECSLLHTLAGELKRRRDAPKTRNGHG